MEILVFWLFWLGFAIAAGMWAANRGRSGMGWFFFAVVLSPLLAFIFLGVLTNLSAQPASEFTNATPATHVKCPDCAELVRREARVCKHCGCKLIPISA